MAESVSWTHLSNLPSLGLQTDFSDWWPQVHLFSELHIYFLLAMSPPGSALLASHTLPSLIPRVHLASHQLQPPVGTTMGGVYILLQDPGCDLPLPTANPIVDIFLLQIPVLQTFQLSILLLNAIPSKFLLLYKWKRA